MRGMLPYCLVRPFVFALDPETAHELAIAGMRTLGAVAPVGKPHSDTPVQVMGLSP
jgi:dihydroorotate dehydrogenase